MTAPSWIGRAAGIVLWLAILWAGAHLVAPLAGLSP